NGEVEDSWIRGQSCHRQLIDVVLECAIVHQVARDVVEPEALAQVVKSVGCFHRVISIVERIEGTLWYAALGAGQSVMHHLLGLSDNGVQVLLVLKTLRVDLINLLGTRWPGCEPTAGSHDFEATD